MAQAKNFILELLDSFKHSHALHFAISSGILDSLRDGSKRVPVLAAEASVPESVGRVLLDILTSLGVTQRVHDLYGLTEPAKHALSARDAEALAAVAGWSSFQFAAYGDQIGREAAGREGAAAQCWIAALDARSRLSGRDASVLRSLLPDPPASLAEIGSGSGVFSRMILDLFPDVRLSVIERRQVFEIGQTIRACDPERLLHLCDDVFAAGRVGPFDAVLTFNFLHLLDRSEIERLAAVVAGMLRKGGRFVAGGYFLDSPETGCPDAQGCEASLLFYTMWIQKRLVPVPSQRIVQGFENAGLAFLGQTVADDRDAFAYLTFVRREDAPVHGPSSV